VRAVIVIIFCIMATPPSPFRVHHLRKSYLPAVEVLTVCNGRGWSQPSFLPKLPFLSNRMTVKWDMDDQALLTNTGTSRSGKGHEGCTSLKTADLDPDDDLTSEQ
jgi:hypothetical protein